MQKGSQISFLRHGHVGGSDGLSASFVTSWCPMLSISDLHVTQVEGDNGPSLPLERWRHASSRPHPHGDSTTTKPCKCRSEGFDRVPTQLLPKTHFEKGEMDRARWWVRGTRHGYWSYPKHGVRAGRLGAELRKI